MTMAEFDADKCRKDSVKIARSYQKLCESDFDDKTYANHEKLRRESCLTEKAISEIEHHMAITPKGKFREIDVHKFDVK